MVKSTKITIIVSALLVIALTAGGVYYHITTIKKVKDECNQVNLELSQRIDSATRSVYRAIVDIAKGQVITNDLVQIESTALTDTAQGLLFDATDIGKVANEDIAAGEDLHKNMVSDLLEKNWQEVEMNCVWLSTNLKQHDFVDIRILFPDGTDYIVCSKKCVQSIKLSKNNMFMWLSEDEILNLDAAIVDANRHKARIYTTKYVDPNAEPANVVTYQPSAAVIDLLNSDPNVLAEAKEHLSNAARDAMEQKLADFKQNVTDGKKNENEIGYDFSLDTTTNGSGLKSPEGSNGSTIEEEEEMPNSDAIPEE